MNTAAAIDGRPTNLAEFRVDSRYCLAVNTSAKPMATDSDMSIGRLRVGPRVSWYICSPEERAEFEALHAGIRARSFPRLRVGSDDEPLVMAIPLEAYLWFRSAPNVGDLHLQLAEYYALLCVLGPSKEKHVYRYGQVERSYLPLVNRYRGSLGDDPEVAIARYMDGNERPQFLCPGEFWSVRENPFGSACGDYDFGVECWGVGDPWSVDDDDAVIEVCRYASHRNRKWEVPRRPPSRAAGNHGVYFVSDGTHTKIGFASDVSRRVASLRTASAQRLKLLGWIPGNQELEGQLHTAFQSKRVRGEWFAVTEVDAIAFVKSRGGTVLW